MIDIKRRVTSESNELTHKGFQNGLFIYSIPRRAVSDRSKEICILETEGHSFDYLPSHRHHYGYYLFMFRGDYIISSMISYNSFCVIILKNKCAAGIIEKNKNKCLILSFYSLLCYN